MKKLILLIALSALLYSAPGYAGKEDKAEEEADLEAALAKTALADPADQEAAAAAKSTAEERSEQAQAQLKQLRDLLQVMTKQVKEAHNQYAAVTRRLQAAGKDVSLYAQLQVVQQAADKRWKDRVKARTDVCAQRDHVQRECMIEEEAREEAEAQEDIRKQIAEEAEAQEDIRKQIAEEAAAAIELEKRMAQAAAAGPDQEDMRDQMKARLDDQLDKWCAEVEQAQWCAEGAEEKKRLNKARGMVYLLDSMTIHRCNAEAPEPDGSAE